VLHQQNLSCSGLLTPTLKKDEWFCSDEVKGLAAWGKGFSPSDHSILFTKTVLANYTKPIAGTNQKRKPAALNLG
jgi:hypothetical protein